MTRRTFRRRDETPPPSVRRIILAADRNGDSRSAGRSRTAGITSCALLVLLALLSFTSQILILLSSNVTAWSKSIVPYVIRAASGIWAGAFAAIAACLYAVAIWFVKHFCELYICVQ